MQDQRREGPGAPVGGVSPSGLSREGRPLGMQVHCMTLPCGVEVRPPQSSAACLHSCNRPPGMRILYTIEIYSHSSGGQRLEVRVPGEWGSGKIPLSGSEKAVLSLCPRVAEGTRKLGGLCEGH